MMRRFFKPWVVGLEPFLDRDRESAGAGGPADSRSANDKSGSRQPDHTRKQDDRHDHADHADHAHKHDADPHHDSQSDADRNNDGHSDAEYSHSHNDAFHSVNDQSDGDCSHSHSDTNHNNTGHDHAGHGHAHHHGHHHHGHGHHHHHHGHAGNKKGLATALVITLGIMLLEFGGGLVTGSLALLSDSGHMLSDAGSLALSLLALWFAGKPASPQRTFGFYRFEILAACFNAMSLFVIAGFIIWEAAGRLLDPPQVTSGPMMLVASVGLLANLLSMWALMKQGDVHGNMNLRSAYLHVIGDALGSVGAIAAGALMLLFGWYAADPIISVLVALLILKGAWSVLKQSIHILMEGTPAALDCKDVQRSLESVEGVRDVHDLHIWTITSGLDALSCHVLIDETYDSQHILQQAIELLEKRFSITHATIQVETPATRHGELKV